MSQKIKWADVPHEEVTPEMIRQIIHGEHIMIVKMTFKDGFEVPKHEHHNEQITQVTKGTIRFWLGEDQAKVVDVHAGECLVIPPHEYHSALIIGDVEATDTFSPPRQDWLDGTDDYLKK